MKLKRTKTEYIKHKARCTDCYKECLAGNAKAWGHIHAIKHGHEVELTLIQRIKPCNPQLLIDVRKIAKAERERENKEREEMQAENDLNNNLDSPTLNARMDDALLNSLEPMTTKELGAAMGYEWSEKVSYAARRIAKLMKERGYRLRQKSRRGRPAWLWCK